MRSFVEQAFKVIDITIKWRGAGVEEVCARHSFRPALILFDAPPSSLPTRQEGFDAANPERVLVKIDPKYFRPTEVRPRTRLAHVIFGARLHLVTDRWSSSSETRARPRRSSDGCGFPVLP